MNETIRFKNRFRITYKGKPLALNSVTTIKGYTQSVFGFTTLDEAIKTRRLYAMVRNVNEEEFKIETYSESQRRYVPAFSEEVSQGLKAMKVFSGKGLKYKNQESPKDNRYNPGKYYGAEVNFAQSAERSKGLSMIAKIKDKRKVFNATETWGKMSALKNDGSISLEYSLVESLRKKNMGKKALKKYLRAANYSVAQSIRLVEKVFETNP